MNLRLIYLFIFYFMTTVLADVRLASLFTDNMVLQRNKMVNVWGTADPGESVHIVFYSQAVNTIADDKGNWELKLSPMEEGGPFELKVIGKNTIILKNVMIGEVWICSGQSNMEFPLNKSEGGEDEISKANYDSIRIFIVKHNVADEPRNICEGEWKVCSPNTISQFSGVGYFFGKNLLNELRVPIGLIQSTWGGTAAECWMPKEILINDSNFIPILNRWDETIKSYPQKLDDYKKNLPLLTNKWILDSIKAVREGKVPPRKPPAPDGPGSKNAPTVLFNGMIAPLIPYTIRGAIWYQGESNASKAHQYRKLFPALIQSWRARWELDDFPFYYVQLPNLNRESEPSKSGWAELRESQLMTLSLPNTGMAVTIDIGDSQNLHPTNKKDVGLRLALIAKSNLYGKHIEYSGPIYKSMKIEEDKIRISFSHTGDKIFSKDSENLLGFTICGNEKIFIEANTKIVENDIIVWNESIKNPIAVRYAWADNPRSNLVNSADLPASPFRTDDWPEVTFDKK